MSGSAERLVESLLAKHDKVHATRVDGNHVLIDRNGLPGIRVLIVDWERLSLADLDSMDIDGLDGIVVAGWEPSYEWAARDAARERGVALLTGKQFFGALNQGDLRDYDLGHVDYFYSRVESHRAVRDIRRTEAEKVDVIRFNLSTLTIFVADIYRLGEADVVSICQRHPDVEIISNLSGWNDYTPEAADEASARGVRVFDLSGLTGALNLEGERLHAYVPRKDR